MYQQPEKTVKMTRELLEIVYDYQFPLWILTKNDLVLRDIDLIKEINKESYACVNFTITLADEKAQKIFEPRASTTPERFEAIRILRKEGIHSGVFCYRSFFYGQIGHQPIYPPPVTATSLLLQFISEPRLRTVESGVPESM